MQLLSSLQLQLQLQVGVRRATFLLRRPLQYCGNHRGQRAHSNSLLVSPVFLQKRRDKSRLLKSFHFPGLPPPRRTRMRLLHFGLR